MTVAFIGSDDYERTVKLVVRMWDALFKLIDDGADIFLFNNANRFDNDFHDMVSQLKKFHPNFQLHYHHGIFDYDIGYVDFMSDFYDKVIFPEKEILLPRRRRNMAMIDKCDVLVTYCSDKPLQSGQENTVLEIEYAKQKKKRVINVFEPSPIDACLKIDPATVALFFDGIPKE